MYKWRQKCRFLTCMESIEDVAVLMAEALNIEVLAVALVLTQVVLSDLTGAVEIVARLAEGVRIRWDAALAFVAEGPRHNAGVRAVTLDEIAHV
eukprot:COSAG06_NODE_52815_length_303_cov_1.460784_1_plen_93_part_10